MKNHYLIILLFITTQTFAQQNKYQIGIEGGPSLTTLRGNDTQDFTYTSSYSVGFALQYNITKLFSIHSNISYEKKGTELIHPTGSPESPYILKFNFDYLTVPILARLSFGTKAKFFVNAGPYFGHLFEPTWEDNSFDFGLVTGLGGQIDLNKNLILSLELRNNLGLSPITAPHKEFEEKSYNNSINFLIGIAYKFKNNTTE